jgi:hypothetical protein
VARHLFGGIAEYVVAPGDEVTVGDITGNQTLLVPSTLVTFWNAATAGSQYTDLQDLSLTPITSVISDENGALPQFWGPDGITVLYADAGGDRRAITPIDLGVDVAANASAIATLQGTVSALAPVAASGQYEDLEGTPALATVATSGQYEDLLGKPAPGLQIVVKVGGSWPPRATTAPDISRAAMWIGPEPAPPAGSGYSLDGDIWMATVA